MTVTSDRLIRPAGSRTVELGEHRVTYLPDGVARLNPRIWFPGTDDGFWTEHGDVVDADGYLAASVGALLVEYGDRNMLIDAGFGPLDITTPVGSLHGGQLPDSLAAAGKTPADIELVAVTHLHLDHIGWLCQTGPRAVFAHAAVVVAETEWSHQDLAIADGVPAAGLAVLADRVRVVAEDEEIFPGVRAVATPGHSLGHTAYVVTGGDRRLIVFGDAITSTVQIADPDLISAADDDPERSRATAAWLVDELGRPGTLGFGMHFADIQFGRVAAEGDRRGWRPE